MLPVSEVANILLTMAVHSIPSDYETAAGGADTGQGKGERAKYVAAVKGQLTIVQLRECDV